MPFPSPPHCPGGAESLASSSEGAGFKSLLWLREYIGGVAGWAGREPEVRWHLPLLVQGQAAVWPGVLQPGSFVLPFGIPLPCVPRNAQPQLRGRDPFPQPQNCFLHPCMNGEAIPDAGMPEPPKSGVSVPQQLTSGLLAQQARVPIARLSQLRRHLQNRGLERTAGAGRQHGIGWCVRGGPWLYLGGAVEGG